MALHKTVGQCGIKLYINLIYELTIPQQDNFTSVEKVSLHEDLHLNVHNSFIHNHQKMETIQILTSE